MASLCEPEKGYSGWTRLCHSDFGSSTSGSTLHWDLPMDEVSVLAKQATRVRIQTKDKPETAVTSKPNTYPIENVRAGVPIGFQRALDEAEVGLFWEAHNNAALRHLWHTDAHWEEHGLKPEVRNLETNVYWAACNGNGLHWHGFVDSGHLRPLSTWDNGPDSDLELYIDTPKQEGDEPKLGSHSTDLLNIIVHNLAGEEVAHVHVTTGERARHVKQQVAHQTGFSRHRLRLSHRSVGLLDDSVQMQDLPAPLELQLVCLPLEPQDSVSGPQFLQSALDGDLRRVLQGLEDLADPNYVHTPVGGDIGVRTPGSPTALTFAAQGGHLQVARVLFDAQAELEKRDENLGITPLLAAVAMGSLEVARFLCDARADINARTRDGTTALHVVAQHGHQSVLKLLCDARAQIDSLRPDGKTALHVACLSEQPEAVRILCKMRADVNKVDHEGCAPLMLAAHRGLLSAVESLCSVGADKNQLWTDGSDATIIALGQGHLEIARHLIKVGASKCRARLDGFTPLLMSAKLGHFNSVRFFWDAQSDKTQTTDEGHTALHLAAIGGHLRIVHFLCKSGCDVNALDKNGHNPLHCAKLHGHLEVARFLRDIGSEDNGEIEKMMLE